MYKVTVLVGKEVVEVEIKAKYCLVDVNNNLVFHNEPVPSRRAVALVSSSRWVSVKEDSG